MASSRRSLLAALWSIVGLLTLTSFVIAILFAYASKKYDNEQAYYYNYEEEGEGENNERQRAAGAASSAISVTSRAMVFAAIWTAVLSGILVIYGTVILGIKMPFTGKYYACCAGNVHRMTPTSLGAFGGSLVMFANLTLVCAILFGEFEVRDFNFGAGNKKEEEDDDYANYTNNVVDQSSYAFSIMCIFFTIMYAAFAALVFYNSNILLEESVADAREEEHYNNSRNNAYSSAYHHHHNDGMRNIHTTAPGNILGGDRFGVGRTYGSAKGTRSIEVL